MNRVAALKSLTKQEGNMIMANVTSNFFMTSVIEDAEKNLAAQLSYGGIVRDPVTGQLAMEYRQGDLGDEIGQMRRLAEAFQSLADALEQDN